MQKIKNKNDLIEFFNSIDENFKIVNDSCEYPLHIESTCKNVNMLVEPILNSSNFKLSAFIKTDSGLEDINILTESNYEALSENILRLKAYIKAHK